MRGNVTIDPLARATAVADPQIREVRSLKSGHIIDACRFIQSIRYDRLVQIRSQIKEAMDAEQPRVVCAICGTPIYVVSSPEKAFFFRHRIEDGSCPAQTRDGLSEDDVRAMKYKGAQESEPHRRLKRLIERSLRADPRFEEVQVETTWRGQRDPAVLRRPDIQATLGGLRIAFEAQLTTTFKSRRWSRKVPGHRAAARAGDPAYRMSEDLRSLLSFLFPTLALSLKPSVSGV